MKIEPFELERLQSIYEHSVEINLSESGVEPVRVHDLVAARELEEMLQQPLAYTQTNGTAELRTAIAGLYHGASVDEVVVTNGGSEANYITCWHLVEPGDDVVVMHPNYMQTHLLATAFGATVRPWRLVEQMAGTLSRWAPDLDALDTLVTDRTKLIVICNPNNPTGARLTGPEVDAICATARTHDAWVLSDEIYQGVERDGRTTASAWGRYERVIVTAGLSKAYGLPGLRIGWAVAPRAVSRTLWGYHDYTTIAPAALSDHLARLALASKLRALLLSRARHIVNTNYTVVRDWIAVHDGALKHIPPEAGAITFVKYDHEVNSTELSTRLIETQSVLVAPGDHFGMDGYLRLGFGGPVDALRTGLARLDRLFVDLTTTAYAEN